MRAVIICGGMVTDYAYIKRHIRESDMIICADSGYNHAAKMQLNVDALLGDFDSIGEIPPGVKTIRYPARKDYTDSEIALEYARKAGAGSFLLLGATGSRQDHTLTNIMLLRDCLERGESAEIVDEHNKIMITNSTAHIQGQTGTILSLVPLTECLGVTTQRLEYPLNNATLKVGKGLGVSNIMLGPSAVVSVSSGVMLIIMSRD